MANPRLTAAFLACCTLVAAGTSSALARPGSASSLTAAPAVHADAPPALGSGLVSAADTSRAAQLLDIAPPRQVAFVPVCYYVYRYAYVCSGGRCVYAYRYVYVCN